MYYITYVILPLNPLPVLHFYTHYLHYILYIKLNISITYCNEFVGSLFTMEVHYTESLIHNT
jgi:hypothetical protein